MTGITNYFFYFTLFALFVIITFPCLLIKFFKEVSLLFKLHCVFIYFFFQSLHFSVSGLTLLLFLYLFFLHEINEKVSLLFELHCAFIQLIFQSLHFIVHWLNGCLRHFGLNDYKRFNVVNHISKNCSKIANFNDRPLQLFFFRLIMIFLFFPFQVDHQRKITININGEKQVYVWLDLWTYSWHPYRLWDTWWELKWVPTQSQTKRGNFRTFCPAWIVSCRLMGSGTQWTVKILGTQFGKW